MVPNGWSKIKLGDLTKVITSGSRDWAKYYAESGSKFIRMTNLNRHGIHLLLDDLKYVSVDSTSSDGKRTALQAGDILCSITAELGKIGWIPENFGEAYINQHTALIRIDAKKADSKFIAYELSSNRINQVINSLNDAGAKAGLNLPTIKAIPIFYPPLNEQQKIAQILSTWDQAISATEKLLENSQQQKKALMQQLLTGKKRLLDESGAQFDGEWKLVKVSNLLKVRKERQVPTAEVPLFSLTIENGITPKSDRYNREFLVKNTEEKKYKVVRPKDIVYNPANLRWGAINFSRLNHSVVVSPIYEVLYVSEKDKVSLEFIAQKLMTKDQINRFAAMVEGTLVERMAVKIEPFLATKLSIPPSLKEQQAIAIVLSKADQQIELLQKKLDCLKQEKKALMQQLLTGKKRVKVAA